MKYSALFLFIFIINIKYSSAQEWKKYQDSASFSLNNLELTAKYLRKSLALISTDANAPIREKIKMLDNLGSIYMDLFEFDSASKALDLNLVLKNELFGSSHPEYIITSINHSRSLYKNGHIVKGEELLLGLLKDLSAIENVDSTLLFQVRINLAELYKITGRHLDEGRQYSLLLKSSSDNLQNCRIHQLLGDYYFRTGNYRKAEESLQLALNNVSNMDSPNQLISADIMNRLVLIHIAAGMYMKAEIVLAKALEITKALEGVDRIKHLATLNNKASLYRNLGNFDKAESMYQELLNLYPVLSMENSPEFAAFLNNFANFYQVTSNFTNAEKLYQRAGDLYLKSYGNKSRAYANVLNNLAGLYRKLGNYDRAESYYKECLLIDSTTIGKYHPDYATTLNNLGILYTVKGDFSLAENALQIAKKTRQITLGNNHPSYSGSLNHLALLYLSRNDKSKAFPLLKESIEIQLKQIESIFPLLSDAEKEAFYETFNSDLERFNSIAIQYIENDNSIKGFLYNARLATKSMLFKASHKLRQNIANSGDPSLMVDFDEWNEIKENLAFYYRLPQRELIKSIGHVKSLEERANDLEKNISLKSFTFAQQVGETPIKWEQIRDVLKPNEAAIEILRIRDYQLNEFKSDSTNQGSRPHLIHGFTDKIYYAAMIITANTQEQPEVVIIKNGNALETEKFAFYQNAIKFDIADNLSFNNYWKLIHENIKGINKVYLSLDGIFHSINLNTLYNPDDKKYLIDQLDIHLITNTKDLLATNSTNKTKFKNTATVIGDPNFDVLASSRKSIIENKSVSPQLLKKKNLKFKNWLLPLPGTKIETKNIDSLLRENQWIVNLFVQNLAMEEKIKQVKSPRVLHIATHGFFDNNYELPDSSGLSFLKNPLFKSGLMLAGANDTKYNNFINKHTVRDVDDGILTAYEAMNLNLDETELVVLSACETGLGEIKSGEGVYGLQRAFRVAGAKNIILSLRKVNDKATEIMMTAFYKHWLGGQNIREAFKSAQLELRTIYKTPYFWGAFVIVGSA